jgi:hypothetical protein
MPRQIEIYPKENIPKYLYMGLPISKLAAY